jgi:hypothetical protein
VAQSVPAPQCWPSVNGSMQLPLQLTSPMVGHGASWQEPFWQVYSPVMPMAPQLVPGFVQLAPVAPQYCSSVQGSMPLTPLQVTGVGSQVPVVTHVPAVHVWPDVQHDEPHAGWPVAHPQLPAVHTWPAGQTIPQPPQLFGSVASVTHMPEHGTWGAVQLGGVVHAPLWQVCPDPQHDPPHGGWPVAVQVHAPFVQGAPARLQVVPHVPQLPLSVASLTHMPEHNAQGDTLGAGHAHMPFWQVSPPLHAVVQLPQWFESVCSLTHEPEQSAKFALHVVVHAPVWQTWPDAHLVPQAPQWLASEFRSTHEPHSVWPEGHVTTHMPFVHVWPAGQLGKAQ